MTYLRDKQAFMRQIIDLRLGWSALQNVGCSAPREAETLRLNPRAA